MAVTTLVCSATRKHYGFPCQALAVWAIKGRDGYWHGACHQHPHQVLKRLGATGDELTVRLATEAMKENERLRNLPGVLTRAEELVEVLRDLVITAADQVPGRTGGDDRWTVRRVQLILRRHGEQECGEILARELLELLNEENVVEHQGEGVYVCVASLPA